MRQYPAGGASLLDELARDALDPAYAAAARRRSGPPTPRRLVRVASWLLVGALLALTFAAVRSTARGTDRARADLTQDVRDRTSTVTELERQIAQLQQDRTRLQQSALASTQEGRRLEALTGQLTNQVGESAVTGSGLSVLVRDAAQASDSTDTSDSGSRPQGETATGRVQDHDLQALVNALWAAGAEAISVGGIRLSPLSAIRTAGGAVLVDYRPVSNPYEVLAIGDSTALERGLRANAATVLDTLHSAGISVSVQQRKAVTVPASAVSAPRYAVPLESSGRPGAPR